MRAKNPLHARSHDPGGSDPVLIAWEDVGTGAGGSVIQFETSPQAGLWLDIQTTGGDGDGLGFHLSDTGSGGIKIDSSSGDIVVDSGGILNVTTETSAYIWAGNPGGLPNAYLTLGADPGMGGEETILRDEIGHGLVLSSSDNVSIGVGSCRFLFTGGSGGAIIARLDSAVTPKQTFEIHQESPDLVLLRVTSDGTYHIQTGATWVADL